jgi:HEAT repeat protein
MHEKLVFVLKTLPAQLAASYFFLRLMLLKVIRRAAAAAAARTQDGNLSRVFFFFSFASSNWTPSRLAQVERLAGRANFSAHSSRTSS